MVQLLLLDNPLKLRGVNYNNLTRIRCTESDAHSHRLMFVPSLILSNVMSLAPKIDEIRPYVININAEIAVFTETWLKSSILDSVIDIPGYRIIRKDRTERIHGGVCIYIKNQMKCCILPELETSQFEVLWIKLQPRRLPRGLSSIVLGAIYHPPGSDNQAMIKYLTDCLTRVEAMYRNCGIIIMGDLNRLKTTSISIQFKLKQLVHFPTRGVRTLDVILTNLSQFYDDPKQSPPFGLSDHLTIYMFPKARQTIKNKSRMIKTRDTRHSNRSVLGRVLSKVDWSCLNNFDSCEEKLTFFNTMILNTLNIVMPIRTKRIHNNDAPWMSVKLKKAIEKRQRAFKDGKRSSFKYYRNLVNSERKRCRSSFYNSKIKNLKYVKPKEWWSAVKRISGMNPIKEPDFRSFLQVDDLQHLSSLQVANTINNSFLEPLRHFDPLQSMNEIDDTTLSVLTVSEIEVYNCLKSLNPSKANGPDDIPSWVLKNYAILLSLPVMEIINCSFRERKLPKSWKLANVVPIPKSTPVQDINQQLRPISLTSILSKVAEDFVVRKELKPDILKILDPNQFGVISGSSTSQALIKMIHRWTEATDGSGASVRVVLFDYQKAFDFVDHSIIVTKLKSLDIRYATIKWIKDFLTNRQQRVKLGEDCFSEWGNVPAGVPQGTKLGPWLFALMINDLNTTSVNDEIKFVDDLTVSESVPKFALSQIQDSVTEIQDWSESNHFRLHEKKCKELRIDFKKHRSVFPPIQVNGKPLELVEEAKLLGLTITSTLKWNKHVNNIISKSSKRIYLLVQLKRAKVPNKEIVNFYTICIRPILEYASTVFHYSLPKYLSDELERVQKRALRIVYPSKHYNEALSESGLATLYARRHAACVKLFNQILDDPNHKLNELVPRSVSPLSYNLRKKKNFLIPKFCTDRFRNSFIVNSCLNEQY